MLRFLRKSTDVLNSHPRLDSSFHAISLTFMQTYKNSFFILNFRQEHKKPYPIFAKTAQKRYSLAPHRHIYLAQYKEIPPPTPPGYVKN